MRVHRFYVSPADFELDHTVWCRSGALRNQWLKVFRYREGDDVVLFDGVTVDRLYKIVQIEQDAIKLEMVTDFDRKLPARHIYLFWSLLKKDKNEWVVQKCTELGVSNFVPVVADRSEKTGFNLERAEKIATEAAEQCGRSDIPHLREPLSLQEAINEYAGKVHMLTAEETLESQAPSFKSLENQEAANDKLPVGIFIGPEGGWSTAELEHFKQAGAGSLNLGNLTLRAETAAVAASAKLLS